MPRLESQELTEQRHEEILWLTRWGKSAGYIAQKLNISRRTVGRVLAAERAKN